MTLGQKGQQKEQKEHLNIMVVNCRSLANKIDKFQTLIEFYEPEVVVAVETWLDEGWSENELSMKEYELHRRDRNRHGGGVMVAVKKCVSGTLLWKDEEVEMLGVKVQAKGGSVEVIAAYRPPGIHQNLIHKLVERVKSMDADKNNVVIAGDLNLPNVNWSGVGNGSSTIQDLVSDIVIEGFCQVVKEGTRVSKSGNNNLLDVVLLRPQELLIKSRVVDGISDHKVPIVTIALNAGTQRRQGKKVYYYKNVQAKEVQKEFKKRLGEWVKIEEDDVEGMWSGFKKVYEEVRDTLVPSKILGRSTDPPFYDKNVKMLKKRGRKLSAWYKRTGKGGDKIKEIRRQTEKAKSKAKKHFMERMFDSSDRQESWRRMYSFVASKKGSGRDLPTLTDLNGIEWVDDGEKAEALNDFYSSVYNKRRVDTEVENVDDSQRESVSVAEVWDVLRKLKNGKSPGVDGIQSELLKLGGRIICEYLARLFQASLRTGKVPLDWKVAIVIPISKGGERGKVENYRPISLTCDPCKILERLVIKRGNRRMKGELNEMWGCQHGFRKSFSCETQLLGFAEDLGNVLDRGGTVDAVFLDFSKAFDKVDHAKLLEKLKKTVEDSEIINWIAELLKGRVQSVRVGTKISGEVEVTSGVPQGSVIGPFLFNVFINDIQVNIKSKIRLFADDCVLYREIKGKEDDTLLQDDLKAVNQWVGDNMMSLNSDKCKVVRFSRKRGEQVNNSYVLGDKTLEFVKCYKYLGVVFSDDLGWSKQVERVSKKSVSSLNFTMRQLKGAGADIKGKAYQTLIRPIVEYASSVWDPYKIGEIKTIEKVQRIAARRVTGRVWKWRVNVDCKSGARKVLERPSEMVRELGWQTLEYRRKVDRLSNFFRAAAGEGGWAELNRYVKFDTSGYGARKGHRFKVAVTGAKTDIGKFSFIRRTGRDWNGVDREVFKGEELKVKEFRKRVIESDKIKK